MNERAQFTELLPNKVLGRVERLRLNPRLRLTNVHRGEHLSGRGGSSTEFSDYRDYVAGDDTRFIDWNIYSRLHRPYLKLFRLEEELNVVVLIDATQSMMFDGKLDLAKQLAAAFVVMALHGGERVSVYHVNNDDRRCSLALAPCVGRAHMRAAFSAISAIEGGGSVTIDRGVETILKHHRGKGMAVLLTDFMTHHDLKRTFNALHGAGLEVFAIQILSPIELDPELNGDVRFVDSESQVTLDVSAVGNLIDIYHEYRQQFQAQLQQYCQQRSGRFMTVGSDAAVDSILFDHCLRQGWIR